MECGIQLCRKGHKVTVVEMTNLLAREANHGHYYSMVKAGKTHTVSCGSVVLSAGMRAKTQEALEYAKAGQIFRLVGDCQKPASVQQAVRSGWTAARTI